MGRDVTWRKWTEADDALLSQLCEHQSTALLHPNWHEIAKHFEGRSWLACRQHWLRLRRGASGAAPRVRMTEWRANGRISKAAKTRMQPPPAALPSHTSLTAAVLGDPLPGRSALDRKRAGVPT
jgi:Myb-like DNA-binding domain